MRLLLFLCSGVRGPREEGHASKPALHPLTFHGDLVLPGSRVREQLHVHRDLAHRVLHT